MSDEEKTKVLWWVIGALLTSVGLNQGINKTFPEVRNDAFTGDQGRVLRNDLRELEHEVGLIDREQWRMIDRMKKREEGAEKCMGILSGHLRNHP